MPCNTAHAFQDFVTAAVDVPLLSIITVTLDACVPYDRSGILLTHGCLASGIYQREIGQRGLEVQLSTPEEAERLTLLARRIKAGERGAEVTRGVRALVERLAADGATAVVAGCTEIPLVLAPDALDVPLLSTTELLARATVAAARQA